MEHKNHMMPKMPMKNSGMKAMSKSMPMGKVSNSMPKKGMKEPRKRK